MIGYIAYRDDVRTWSVEERRFLGLRLLGVTLPRGRKFLGKRCALRAARAMGRLGIRQAVFPEDFPWTELFARRGVLPVDPLPLYRRLAPRIVKQRMADLGLSPGAVTVAAVGEDRFSGLDTTSARNEGADTLYAISCDLGSVEVNFR